MAKGFQMIKWKFLIFVVLAGMTLAAWTAHADGEIKVIIEGEEVKFEKSPVVENGTTLVPFRVLFERLGLAVEWVQETKTIVGRGEDITIRLQLESKTAVINGEAVELASAPRVIDGSTYVPLRLVGEATGRQVSWDHAARTITISAAPSASFDFEAFYRSFVAASNAEDAEAVLAAIHPESPILAGGAFEAQMIDGFRQYDVLTELEWFELVEADESEALLYTIETNINTNGLFYMDNRMEVFLDLVKDEAGQWKIYDVTPFAVEYLVSEDVLTADAGIDANVEKAILGVVEANLEATAAEDLEAMMDTIDPASPAYDEAEETYGIMFLLFDFEYEMEFANVVAVTDTDAFVYTVQTAKKVDGPMVDDIRSKAVHQLKKQADGSWKLYATYAVATEPLE